MRASPADDHEERLPCDFVITFIQDTEKHWWLYTRCGVVGFSDAELQKWWANPDAMIRNRIYDAFDGAQPNIGSFNAAASTSDGRVWFSSGVVVQMLDPSGSRNQPGRRRPFRRIRDRRPEEFAAIDNLEVGPHPRDLQIDYTSPTFSIRRSSFATSSMATTTVGVRPVCGGRRSTPMCLREVPFRVMAANSDGVWNEAPQR